MFSASESSSADASALAVAHHAGDRGRLRQTLLLDEELERAVAAPAGRDFEHPGLVAFAIEHGPDAEALEQRAASDILGELLDRDAGLHTPDVALAEDELVEGCVARGAEGDLLDSGSHVEFSATGGRKPLSRPPTRHEIPSALFLSETAAPGRECGSALRRNIRLPPVRRLWRRQ
jgi:hypothetical protein